jgi:hypothetical protein
MIFVLLFDLVDCVPPCVIPVDGGDVVLTPVTAVGSGDINDTLAVDAAIILGEIAFFLASITFLCAWPTAICLDWFTLLLLKCLHACIASGTVDAGHRNKYTMVRSMRLSAH